MSYKNIGTLLSSLKHVGTDSHSIATSIADMGTEAAKTAMEFAKIPKDTQFAAFAENLGADAAKAALGITEVGAAATASTTGISAFGAALKGVWASIAPFALPAVGAIAAGWYVYSQSFSKAQKDFEKAANDHNNTLAEIESINSELETTQSRIDELKAKGHLTFTEQTELSNLQAQNAELERTLKIKEQLEEYQGKKAAEEAAKAMDKTVDKNKRGLVGYDPVTGQVAGEVETDGYPDALKNNIQILQKYDKQLEKLRKDQSKLSASDPDFGKKNEKLEKQITDLETKQSELNARNAEYYEMMSGWREQLTNNATGKPIEGYAEYVKEIDEAFKALDDYQNTTPDIDKAINGIFSKVKFDGFKDKLAKAGSEGIDALTTALNSGDYDSVINSIADSLDISESDAKEKLSDYIMSIADPDSLDSKEVKKQLGDAFIPDFKDSSPDARKSAKQAWESFTSGMSDEDFEILYSIKQDNDTSTWEIEDWANAFSKAKESAQEVANEIKTITDETNTAITSINKVNSVLSSQQTGKSISSEDFNSEELKDYQSALEYVNGSMQLNTDKVKELSKAKVDEKLATNDVAKAQKQQDYVKNAAQIDVLRKKLEANNLARGETTESIQAQIDSLLNSNSAIVNECAQIDVLNSALRESIGVYQQWLDAQNGSDYGDMFSDSLNAFQRIKDTYNKDSDIYGDFGSKKFDAAVDFLVPDTVDKNDTDAISSYMSDLNRYLTFDDNGNANGMDISQFCQDAVDKGLMVLDEAGENYEVAGQTTMEDFANGMNLSLPLVQAFFDEMQLKGGDFDWADEGVQTLGDLAVKASDAADALQATDQFKDMDIQIDVSGMETTEEKVSALDATIAQMQQAKTIAVDDSQVQSANDIIQYCVQQKQALNEPAVMSVDTSLVQGQVGEAVSLLQQFQQAQNELEVQTAIGVDTSEAESKVAGLASEIQGIDPHITAALEIDTSNADAITASIATLSPEIMVKAGIDESAVIGYTPENKDATVKYGIDTSAVDGYSPPNFNRTVTYTISTIGTPPSGGTQGLNGTAHAAGNFKMQHAYGTAMANGSWAAKQGGTTLVGELGREIVVNPYSGRWHTVGDNGAEFTHIPKGAIVFNHKQTEALLERGWVNGRGSVLATGTAMVTGGIPVANANRKNKNQHSYSGNSSSEDSSSTPQNTAAVDRNTDSTDKNTKSNKSLQDWIEQLISVQKAENGRLYDAIEDFEMNANHNKAIDNYVSDSESYMDTLRQAQNRYMTKANALGVPGNYVHKIWAGELDIEDIQDEDLKEKISQYQTWCKSRPSIW